MEKPPPTVKIRHNQTPGMNDPAMHTVIMKSDRNESLKREMAPFRATMYDFDADMVREKLNLLVSPDARLRMCHPFGNYGNADEFFEACLAPLHQAFPDLEARDEIMVAGTSPAGQDWVGIMGNFVGTFARAFLDIPPTGLSAYMRYHEFYRFDGAQVVETQTIWDIPQLMMQANAWPASPGLGREWRVPGPARHDGCRLTSAEPQETAMSQRLVIEMLEQMLEYPAKGGPEKMELHRFWHPKMSWYGPSGIGSARGFGGFYHWHMIPWVRSMPDWSDLDIHEGGHFIGDGPYVAVTGWPSMRQTHVADGFLALPPTGKQIDIRCLDFWRVENDLIRENWVMVDMLDFYAQLGVDILARMREFNKARTFGGTDFPAAPR